MSPELLKLFYLGQPFAIAIALAVGVAAFGGAVISRPVVPLVLYLSVYFVFAQSNYGSLDVFRSNPVYARGSGQLFYPALCWTLLVMVFWAWLGRRFMRLPAPSPSPLRHVLWAWAALLVLHLAVGLALGEPAARILEANGFSMIVWLLPLLYLMHAAGRDDEQLDLLGRLLVLAALAKSLFGLGRLLAMGGDPSNVYQNLDRIDIRLTYFDICDSLVCLLGAAAAAAMLLVAPSPRHGRAWRLLCAVTLVLALVCIVLSYRRTAWGGLVLAALWLLWRAPARWRWPLLLGALPLGVAAVGMVAAQRLSQPGMVGGWSALFYDLQGRGFGPESTRLLELKLAWAAFVQSPLLGIGAWGRYTSAHLIPWQLLDGGAFLHSGALHVAMKAGLLGVALLLALVAAFLAELRRALDGASPAATVLAVVAGCGLLFLLPDWLLGTPVPQLRTMQLTGLCLGLPGLVLAARRARP